MLQDKPQSNGAKFALMLALAILTGCAPPNLDNGNPGDGDIPKVVVSITSVALNLRTFPLEVGTTYTLTATAQPDNATEAVVWTSSDAAIASVSDNGAVTAVSVGTATVTAASPSDGNIKEVATVTVVPAGSLLSIADKFTFLNQAGVNADSTQELPKMVSNVLTLSNTNSDSLVKATVEKNTMVIFSTPMTGDFKFRATVKMTSRLASSADRGVTIGAYAKTAGEFGTAPPMAAMMFRARGDVRSYSHSNALAYSAGSPNIVNDATATYDVERILEVKRVSATGYTFSIYVPKTGALESIASVNQTADTLNALLDPAVTGTNEVYLAMTVGGVTANFSNIEITTDLTPGATPLYQSGAVAAGAVPLKGISVSGPSNNPSAVYEYQNALTAMAVTTLQLTSTASPTYADNTAVTWASSAESVATVSATGLVNVVGAGTATITATSVDGGFQATYDLNISSAANPVTSVAVSGPSSLMVGLDCYPTAALTPSNATVQTVTWSTSDSSKATVDASTGKVTAIATGSVTITATATDGTGISGTLNLTVTAATTAIWSWNAATDTTFALYNAANTPVYPTVNGKTLVGRSATTILSFNNSTGVVLANNRFIIGSATYDTASGGATLGATTGTVFPTDGQFNFTKKAKLTIGYSTASVGASNGLTVYLNNNVTSDSATTSMIFQAADALAVPPLLAISSKLYETSTAAAPGTFAPVITPGTPGTLTYYIDPLVFTKNPQTLAKAFLQIRSGSAGTITITSISVDYEP